MIDTAKFSEGVLVLLVVEELVAEVQRDPRMIRSKIGGLVQPRHAFAAFRLWQPSVIPRQCDCVAGVSVGWVCVDDLAAELLCSFKSSVGRFVVLVGLSSVNQASELFVHSLDIGHRILLPYNASDHRVAASDVDLRFSPDRQPRCMVLLCVFVNHPAIPQPRLRCIVPIQNP